IPTQISVIARPIKPARMLALIESSPSVGDTLLSSSMLTGVCNGFSSTLGKSTRNLCVAAVDCVLNNRSGLDHSIKHNRETMMNVRRSNVAELLGPVGIKSQMDNPAVFFIGSAGARHTSAG